jgi:hypothetical protein
MPATFFDLLRDLHDLLYDQLWRHATHSISIRQRHTVGYTIYSSPGSVI